MNVIVRYPVEVKRQRPRGSLHIGVGAREHHARYLGTASIAAHAWCE